VPLRHPIARNTASRMIRTLWHHWTLDSLFDTLFLPRVEASHRGSGSPRGAPRPLLHCDFILVMLRREFDSTPYGIIPGCGLLVGSSRGEDAAEAPFLEDGAHGSIWELNWAWEKGTTVEALSLMDRWDTVLSGV